MSGPMWSTCECEAQLVEHVQELASAKAQVAYSNGGIFEHVDFGVLFFPLSQQLMGAGKHNQDKCMLEHSEPQFTVIV